MNITRIFKARAQSRNQAVSSLCILFDREIPDVTAVGPTSFAASNKMLEEQDQIFQKEAVTLENDLYYALPGGTYDALLRAMLLRRANHFQVTFEEIE